MTARAASLPIGMPARLVALDHLRGFVILLVVLHHTILAYCTFDHIDRRHYLLSTAPIVDPERWAVFDSLIKLNDAFFMPLMFLLSGLFVWSGLSSKGAGPYLRGRLIRLGVPFAVAVLTIVPLAYYPSFRQAGGPPGFIAFLATTVSAGPWPSGPLWFVAVLLLFDAAAASMFAVFGRRMLEMPATAATPGRCFCILLAGSLVAYLPLLAAAGPARWVSFGPAAVQESRIGLYATYFAAGVVFGAREMRRAFPFGAVLARGWVGWTALAALTGMALLALGSLSAPAWLGRFISGTVLAVFCAATCFALAAAFLRFDKLRLGRWLGLATNGYGIYLLHYPAVTWVQYGLLQVPVGAVMKATITFAAALLASWGGAILLRRIPRVDRVV